jgi:hypothetical protein
MPKKSTRDQDHLARFFELSNKITGRPASPAQENYLRQLAMTKARDPTRVAAAGLETLRQLAQGGDR